MRDALEVRRARVEDAGGIARAWVRAWQVAYRGLVPDEVLDALDVDERRALWRERLEGGDCTFVVEDLGIAGYCRVVPPSEIASLYVLPERRRGGVGSALLAAAWTSSARTAPTRRSGSSPTTIRRARSTPVRVHARRRGARRRGHGADRDPAAGGAVSWDELVAAALIGTDRRPVEASVPEGSPPGLADMLAARGAEDRLLGAAAAWTVARRAGALAGPRGRGGRARGASTSGRSAPGDAAADDARGHVPVAAAGVAGARRRARAAAAAGARPGAARPRGARAGAARGGGRRGRAARALAGRARAALGLRARGGRRRRRGLGGRRARGAPRAARAAAPPRPGGGARAAGLDVRRGDLGGPRGVRRDARRRALGRRTSRCWRPRSTTAASPSATRRSRCSSGSRARASPRGWRRAPRRCCAWRTTRWSSTLPDTPDAAAARDGVPAGGRRSERLRWMLAATPLATWTRRCARPQRAAGAAARRTARLAGRRLAARLAAIAPAARLLALPVRDDLADVVHSGWVAAAIAQRDAAWARALWDVRPEPELLLALPHDEAQRIAAAAPEPDVAARALPAAVGAGALEGRDRRDRAAAQGRRARAGRGVRRAPARSRARGRGRGAAARPGRARPVGAVRHPRAPGLPCCASCRDRRDATPQAPRRAALRRRAGGARARRRPAAPAALEALALGRHHLPARRRGRRRRRSRPSTSAGGGWWSWRSRRSPPTARCSCSACPARPRRGCPSTSARRSPATARSSSRAPRARPRRRCATAGTTRGCWPRARRATRSSPARCTGRWQAGKLARVEELTRIPSDVQDALITILSREVAADPRARRGDPGRPGLQRDRHRQRPRPRRQRPLLRHAAALQHRRAAAAGQRRRGGRDRAAAPRRGRRDARAAAGDLRAGGDPPRGDDLPRAALRA